MNELAPTRWTSSQTRSQYRAIAWLRWRILMNSFRRKGGVGDIVAIALVAPLFAVMALAVAGGAGFGAWYFAQNGELTRIGWMLWGTFLLCQFLNINIGQPGTIFDPAQLIRFPLRMMHYVFIRLFFGILSPANVMVALISLSIAIGISVARPALWPYAAAALLVFAATNAIFTRMVFAWVDRWLSTRRAREIFTALIFAGSLGFQWANVTFNPAYGHHHSKHGVKERRLTTEQQERFWRAYQHVKPAMNVLPPGLIGQAIVEADRGSAPMFALETLGCAAYGALFFFVFAVRTRTEFLGEVFSDQANAVAALPKPPSGEHPASGYSDAHAAAPTSTLGYSRVGAIFAKEILTIRRNTGVFYALVAPIVMVFLFAGRLASRNNSIYIFPAALAYALVGVIPLAFNSFGLEGAGSQFYFLAPVRLRDVFLAKNMINFLLSLAEVIAVFAIISYQTGVPSLEIYLGGLLWAIATLLVTTTVGNRRSIASPKKIDLGRTSSKQAAPLSALLSIGMLLVSAAIGYGILLAAKYLGEMWIVPVATAAMAVVGFGVYAQGLTTIERYTLAHRDELFQELCKK